MADEVLLRLVVPGELPALNEIIAAAKSHFGSYSSMKKKHTEVIKYYAINYKLINKPVHVTIWWYTKDLKKDPDNVEAGIKFILDGLKDAGVIVNDTRQYIKGITHMFPDPEQFNNWIENCHIDDKIEHYIKGIL